MRFEIENHRKDLFTKLMDDNERRSLEAALSMLFMSHTRLTRMKNGGDEWIKPCPIGTDGVPPWACDT